MFLEIEQFQLFQKRQKQLKVDVLVTIVTIYLIDICEGMRIKIFSKVRLCKFIFTFSTKY